jgi:hypothetical protein
MVISLQDISIGRSDKMTWIVRVVIESKGNYVPRLAKTIFMFELGWFEHQTAAEDSFKKLGFTFPEKAQVFIECVGG